MGFTSLKQVKQPKNSRANTKIATMKLRMDHQNDLAPKAEKIIKIAASMQIYFPKTESLNVLS